MGKLTLEVKALNFKKLPYIEEVFKSGYLYLVKGSNNIGKTSFWQSIKMILLVDNKNPNILKFGMKEGFVDLTIIKNGIDEADIVGGDGEIYKGRCEFKEGREDKFSLLMPDATIRRSKKEIRDVLKYNGYDIEEFLGWGLTEAGRKKQAAAILEFLPKDTQDRINFIDAQVNNKNGILYYTRSGKNEVLQGLKKVYEQSLPLTAEEEKMLSNETSTIETLNIIKAGLNALELTRSSQGNIIQQKAELTTDYNVLLAEYKTKNENYLSFAERTLNEIKVLEKTILDKKSELEKESVEIEKYQKVTTITLEDIQSKIDNMAPSTFDQEKYDTLKLRKEKGDEYLNTIKTIKTKKENIDLGEQKLEKAQKEWKDLDDKIEELRIEKKTLFEQAKLPMDNIIINDGELFFVDEQNNQLAFTEEQISYSVAGKRIAKLLLERNKNLPIICLGKAAEYDDESLKEIDALAKQYDAIIFCDKVIPGKEELSIEVFETNE